MVTVANETSEIVRSMQDLREVSSYAAESASWSLPSSRRSTFWTAGLRQSAPVRTGRRRLRPSSIGRSRVSYSAEGGAGTGSSRRPGTISSRSPNRRTRHQLITRSTTAVERWLADEVRRRAQDVARRLAQAQPAAHQKVALGRVLRPRDRFVVCQRRLGEAAKAAEEICADRMEHVVVG